MVFNNSQVLLARPGITYDSDYPLATGMQALAPPLPKTVNKRKFPLNLVIPRCQSHSVVKIRYLDVGAGWSL